MAVVSYAPYLFEAPEGWQDRTVAAFFAPAAPGEAVAPNVVVTREPRRDGDKLRTHVQRQMLVLSNILEGFDILESEEIVVAGRRAMQTRCVWKAGEATIEQTVVHVEPDEFEPTVLTVTCTSSIEAASSVWPVFERLVGSLKTVAAPTAAPPLAQVYGRKR